MLLEVARGLLAAAYAEITERGITLIGLSLSQLSPVGDLQPELPIDWGEGARLDTVLDSVRERFGADSVARAGAHVVEGRGMRPWVGERSDYIDVVYIPKGSRMSSEMVAVLGLGTMGRAFAVNLAAAGFTVTGFNRTERDGLEGLDLTVVSDAASAVEGARVVLSMLTDAAATSAVLLAEDTLQALAPGAIVVNTATIGVAEVGELARSLAHARPDLIFVDAPVSGSKGPVERGSVTILASSDADTESLRERLAPVFGAIGRRTVWLGATGAGSAMKIVVNTWLVHVMQGIAETALLARSLGIDPQAIADTLSGGPLDTPYAAAKLRKIGAGDYSAEMALSLGAKDARLAVEAGAGLSLPVSQLIASLWSEVGAVGEPLGGQDVSAIYEALRDRTGA